MLARALFLLLALTSVAQEAAPAPSAGEILAMVRQSYAAQNQRLKGSLRDSHSGRREDLQLTLDSKGMVLEFAPPMAEKLILELRGNQALLWEEREGKRQEVAPELSAQPLRGMPLNREDISLRFTHWNRTDVHDANAKLGAAGVACWLVRCVAPDRRGPYGTVDLWVEKQSGGIAKMQAHDVEGRLVNRFQVTKLQRIGELSMLREMRIEALDPASGKTSGRCYLTLEAPPKAEP